MTLVVKNKWKNEWMDEYHDVSRCEIKVINKEILVLDIYFNDGHMAGKEYDPENYEVIMK